MKVGGINVLGVVNKPLFVVTVATATLPEKKKAAGSLEELSSLSSCPNSILAPVLSLTFIFIDVCFKISSDEDCFSRQTVLCPFLDVVFCMLLEVFSVMFLQQSLTRLNEMHK